MVYEMARSRNIKPGFFHNEELVDLPFEARLLFIGLWTIADREGRLEDRPKKIKMQVFPADQVDVDLQLNSLQSNGLIIRYSTNNIQYIQIINFLKHQHPHMKEVQSTIPAPDLHHANPSDSLLPITENLIPIQDKRTKKFVQPTKDEAMSYCLHKEININLEDFFDYYNSNGWKVGKNNMKCWKSTLNRWSRKHEKNGQHNQSRRPRTAAQILAEGCAGAFEPETDRDVIREDAIDIRPSLVKQVPDG